MKEFSIQWLLQKAKEDLRNTQDDYDTILNVSELEDNIKYMENLIKEGN